MRPDAATIFATASGPTRAAVALVRISGPDAAAVLAALCGSLPPARRLVLRSLRAPESGDLLDRALVVWMPGPATYTGEDMAELHLHGGLAVRAAILDALAHLPGCAPAKPGAFTRRAFLNGRMDLTEAEAAADLIEAETEAQRRQALRQLDGALGERVSDWRTRLIDALAAAEAALDFSDEGDVDDAALDAGAFARLAGLRAEIGAVLDDGRRGERLRDGFTVVLAGAPNVGKSTLLNALSCRDVAIVSATPGTTRDAIEVRCDLAGLPVLLVDTAGLRETEDAVEAEGIRRTVRRVAQADLVLDLAVVGDGPAPPLAEHALRVWTKADLGGAPADGLAISAMTGGGVDALLETIGARARDALGSGDALLTRARHRDALARCQDHLDRLLGSGPAAAPELLAEDLRLAVRALGEVAGHVAVEEMLDRLFASFCIGK